MPLKVRISPADDTRVLDFPVQSCRQWLVLDQRQSKLVAVPYTSSQLIDVNTANVFPITYMGKCRPDDISDTSPQNTEPTDNSSGFHCRFVLLRLWVAIQLTQAPCFMLDITQH